MKTTTATLLALILGIAVLKAQNEPAAQPTPQGGPEPRRAQPPMIVATLDANADGVIDATEIANASAALKALDKNGDGKITVEELRRSRPARAASSGVSGETRKPRGPRAAEGERSRRSAARAE